jgi:serine/threonine protein kinase
MGDNEKKLKVVGELGRGKFSVCYLVKHISSDEHSTQKFYCWKKALESTAILSSDPRNDCKSIEDLSRTEICSSSQKKLQLENDLLRSLECLNCRSTSLPFIISSFGFHVASISEAMNQTVSLPGLLLKLGARGTLAQHLRLSTVSIRQCQLYSSEILTALQFLHSYPPGAVIHRDIKSANILIDENGHVLLSDFGSAKILSRNPSVNHTSSSSNRTYTMPVGTPHILAPEMVALLSLSNSRMGYDESVDYWALGILLYEMLTQGALPPFQDINILSINRSDSAAGCIDGGVFRPVERSCESTDLTTHRTFAEKQKYWDFEVVDDFWISHFPKHRFASTIPAEKCSSLSLERLASLISVQEEVLLQKAHTCIKNLLLIDSHQRRQFIVKQLSNIDVGMASDWFVSAVECSQNVIAVDNRLGCAEWLLQLQQRDCCPNEGLQIEPNDSFSGF